MFVYEVPYIFIYYNFIRASIKNTILIYYQTIRTRLIHEHEFMMIAACAPDCDVCTALNSCGTCDSGFSSVDICACKSHCIMNYVSHIFSVIEH